MAIAYKKKKIQIKDTPVDKRTFKNIKMTLVFATDISYFMVSNLFTWKQ